MRQRMDHLHPAFDVKNVSKRFGDGPTAVTALDDCTLSVLPGEMVALSGPSGSGKSTLLGVMLGWVAPDSGSVKLQTTTQPIHLTVVPQDLGLLEELSAGENIGAPQMFNSVGQNAAATIEILGLGDLVDRFPDELSLGEQQRVAVARAIATDAPVIVADEPTSHQDEDNATLVMSALRSAADRGAAVLLTTHDPRIVASCDRLLEILDGRLDSGTVAGNPQSPSSSQRRSKQTVRKVRRLLVVLAAVTALVLAYQASAVDRNDPADVEDTALDDEATVAELTNDPEFDEVNVLSAALGSAQRTLVLVPPGYAESERRYPVLYLLHSEMDRPEMFRRIGVFNRAGELMRRSEIEPFIIVAPDIGDSFGVNNPESAVEEVPNAPTPEHDDGRYEAFVAQDLIDFVDSNYRSETGRDDRFVGGISMGGFAALHLGVLHPELFSRVGGHSPALVASDLNWLHPSDDGRSASDPFGLAVTADLAETNVFLDAGESDRLELAGSIQHFEQALAGARTVTVEIWPGQHDDTYWRRQVDTYLRFYGS